MTIEINNQDGTIYLDNIVVTQSISANILIANSIQNSVASQQVNFPATPTVSGSYLVYHQGNLDTTIASLTGGLNLRLTDVEIVNALQTAAIQALSASDAGEITKAEVASLTGSLQTQITANGVVDAAQQVTLSQLTSLSGSYATLPVVASLTGSLQTQITANTVVDNAQQATLAQITSVTGSFATNVVVASLTGSLQTQITANGVVDAAQQVTLAQLTSVTGSFVNAAYLAPLTGSLQTQITANGVVDAAQQVTLSQLTSVTGSLITTAAVASLTGSLQTQITANGVVDAAQQVTLAQITSVTGSFATNVVVASLTGSLQTQITANVAVDNAQQATLAQIAGVTGNFVDKTTTQIIGGFKTFTSAVNISGNLNVGPGVIVYSPLTSTNWSTQPNGLEDAVDLLASNKFKSTGATTTSAATEIFVNGIASSRIVIPTNTTYTFTLYVAARRTDSGTESGGYKFEGVIRNVAGTVGLINSAKTVLAEDTAAWDVAIAGDNTNKSLNITVTGQNAKTISWAAYITLFPV